MTTTFDSRWPWLLIAGGALLVVALIIATNQGGTRDQVMKLGGPMIMPPERSAQAFEWDDPKTVPDIAVPGEVRERPRAANIQRERDCKWFVCVFRPQS